MPPRSRGAHGVRNAPSENCNGNVPRATKSKGKLIDARRTSPANPVGFLLLPFKLTLLVVLHVFYAAWLGARMTWHSIRTIAENVKEAQDRDVFVRSFLAAEHRFSIRSANDACSQRRISRLDPLMDQLKMKMNDHVLTPRHVAMSIGKRPSRGIMALLAQPLRRTSAEQIHKDMDFAQHRYMLANMKAMLLYCTLSGIPQVTLYDELGMLVECFGDCDGSSFTQYFDVPGHCIRNGEEDGVLFGQCVRLEVEVHLYRPVQKNSANGPNGSANGATGKLNGHAVNGTNVVRRNIRVNLMGPEDGHDAIARCTGQLAQRQTEKIDDRTLRQALVLQGFPSDPDLLILHGGDKDARQAPRLRGFPPMMLQLCEIFHDNLADQVEPLSFLSFERALQRFAQCEQRYGK